MSKLKFIIHKIANLPPRYLLLFYTVLAAIITLQKRISGDTNNFNIFRASVYHFFDHKNMYVEYPAEHFDLFLYNPVFPIFFAPFAYLPYEFAFFLWVLLTLYILYYALTQFFDERWKIWTVAVITLPEVIISTQYTQINHSLAAFMILIFLKNLKEKPIAAGLFTNLAFFVKAYPAAAGLFYFLTPKPFTFSQLKEWKFWRKFLILLIIFLCFLFLPALFYGFEGWKQLYAEWRWSLSQDYSVNDGMSVMGFVRTVFGAPKIITPVIQVSSMLLVLFMFVALIVKKAPTAILRTLYLPFIIIWIVIFNQVAESPTYVIASIGMAIWYVQSKRTRLENIIFVLCILFCVLAMSDVYPRHLREYLVNTYSIKALPCFILWVYLFLQLCRYVFSTKKILTENAA